MTARTLLHSHPALRDDIGDLVTRRPVPGPALELLDPFLFLNHHGPQHYRPNNHGLPFGPHPHRGFETVTFMLEGELAHTDSSGQESIIGAGGIQWMTAGDGLVHAELSPESFKRQGGDLEILQLWVNLPARLKRVQPHYVGLQADALPVVERDGARIVLVSGELEGVRGPIDSLTGLHLMTLHLPAGTEMRLPVAPGREVFLYSVRGALNIAGQPAAAWHLHQLDKEGDEVALRAEEDAVVLFGHGQPLDEPVFSHGPFVMNTREEILEAIADYRAGKFGGL